MIEAPAFAIGSDISWASEMERDGKGFSDENGNSDIFAILKALGQNSVRLRVWVNPIDPDGWSGKADMLALARRAKSAGMALMVDFHYSDFFADPNRQLIPLAWTDESVPALSQKIREHTVDVLNALKAEEITPVWIQVGNETRNGLLWPTGRLNEWTVDGFRAYAELSNAGYDAVKSVFPSSWVIVHMDNGYKDCVWWYRNFKDAGGRFDMIGLSHYPMYQEPWDACNTALATNIGKLSSAFGVNVMVCETGIFDSDFAAGARCLSDLMTKIGGLESCMGVFYWEPEVYGYWKPSIYDHIPARYGGGVWNSYNMGAFTSEGKPSEALKALKK
jgi:arabinogalactan endo-1,4-beta-galactosidase